MFEVNNVDNLPAGELRFLFLSGRPSLDLVATIGERWRRRFERLRRPEDLTRWLEAADLPVTAAAGDHDLQRARALRTAIEGLAVAAQRRQRPPADAVVAVNEQAARPDLAPQLVVNGEIARLRGEVDAALATIARDAADLFGGPLAARVKECARDDCALLFLDTSRPGTRRWCSMAGCGNRTKTARYRRGKQATA